MIKKLLFFLISVVHILWSPCEKTIAQPEGSGGIVAFQGGEVIQNRSAELEIWVPKLNGNIRIDGELEDEGWNQAARIHSFFETEPGDNIEPSVETEVWIVYDDHALYAAFHCYDDPASIRATLSDRDQSRADDIIFIILDTFRNRQTAYQLGVNPFGLQVDAIRNMDEQDATFDIVWHSAGRIVDDGWVAEMAVPSKVYGFQTEKNRSGDSIVSGFGPGRATRRYHGPHGIGTIPVFCAKRLY